MARIGRLGETKPRRLDPRVYVPLGSTGKTAAAAAGGSVSVAETFLSARNERIALENQTEALKKLDALTAAASRDGETDPQDMLGYADDETNKIVQDAMEGVYGYETRTRLKANLEMFALRTTRQIRGISRQREIGLGLAAFEEQNDIAVNMMMSDDPQEFKAGSDLMDSNFASAIKAKLLSPEQARERAEQLTVAVTYGRGVNAVDAGRPDLAKKIVEGASKLNRLEKDQLIIKLDKRYTTNLKSRDENLFQQNKLEKVQLEMRTRRINEVLLANPTMVTFNQISEANAWPTPDLKNKWLNIIHTGGATADDREAVLTLDQNIDHPEFMELADGLYFANRITRATRATMINRHETRTNPATPNKDYKRVEDWLANQLNPRKSPTPEQVLAGAIDIPFMQNKSLEENEGVRLFYEWYSNQRALGEPSYADMMNEARQIETAFKDPGLLQNYASPIGGITPTLSNFTSAEAYYEVESERIATEQYWGNSPISDILDALQAMENNVGLLEYGATAKQATKAVKPPEKTEAQ